MKILQKGDKIPLSELIDETVSHIVVGLGWDPAPLPGFFASLMGKKNHIDLNLVCLVFDKDGKMIANITGDNMAFGEKAVMHTGDDKMGTGSGDDEQVFVNPARVPQEAEHLVFAMYSQSGQPFSEIRNVICRVATFPGDMEMIRYALPSTDTMKTHMIARLSRNGNDWLLHAIGESVAARTAEEYRDLARRQFA